VTEAAGQRAGATGIILLTLAAGQRRVVRQGFMSLFAGLVVLVALLDVGVGPEIVTRPLLLAGAGLGAMASQLGSVTVSAVSDEQSGEVGGLQNTGSQLGASIGTALAGALLISALTAHSSQESGTILTFPTASPRRQRRTCERGPVHPTMTWRLRSRMRTSPRGQPMRSWRRTSRAGSMDCASRCHSWPCWRWSPCYSPEGSRRCSRAPNPDLVQR
jgi:hypothetical protein